MEFFNSYRKFLPDGAKRSKIFGFWRTSEFHILVPVFNFFLFFFIIKKVGLSSFFLTWAVKPFILFINSFFLFFSVTFFKFYPILFYIFHGESLLEFFTFSIESVDDITSLLSSFFLEQNVVFSSFFIKLCFFHKSDPLLNFFPLFSDFSSSLQPRGFQFPESYNMFLLIKTHNFIFGYCVFIFFFVCFFLIVTLFYYVTKENYFFRNNFIKDENANFSFLQIEKFITRIINISFQGTKPRDIEELYFFQQYNFVETSDSIFLESIPFQKNFATFYTSNNIYLPFDRYYFIPKFDNSEVINSLYSGSRFLKPQVFTKGKSEVGSLEIFKSIINSYDLINKKVPTVFLCSPISEPLENSSLEVSKNLTQVKFPYSLQQDYIGYYWLLSNKNASVRARSHLWDNLAVEIIWTLIPTLILIAIALPSFSLLYAFEPTVFYDSNTVFLKIIGHQWYRSYEFPNETFALLQKKGNFPKNVEQSFSSYMLPVSELKEKMPRLLSVDNPIYLPAKSNIIIRVTSEDVIHSWAIPSLGVKVDCIPGRINEFVFRIRSVGDLYGQCSELCGVNHGFMPIHIISYDINTLE